MDATRPFDAASSTTPPQEPSASGVIAADREALAARFAALTEEVGRVVVGQREMVQGLLIGLLTAGHVLLEGVPGLAKTLTVSTLAQGLDAKFSRVQFTPDLLPADLIGTLIYDPRTHEFSPRKGPIFANIVLADEINRAPAKVQSALLEAMQERQVTIGDTTYPLEAPFLVLATQNPVEQEGTYRLPEAQVDRFLLKLTVGYPTRDDEREIVDRMAAGSESPSITPTMSANELVGARRVVEQLTLVPAVRDYIVDLVQATRDPSRYGLDIAPLIEFGASPRGSIALARAARSHAFLAGRSAVIPTDVKAVAMMVLGHRVTPSFEAQAEDETSESIVQRVLDHIPTP